MQSERMPGLIEPGCIVLASEARRCLRLGPKAWKGLRDAGLPIRYVGRQAFVLSDDLIEALKPEKAVTHA
jgi:hypothetical protein